MTPIRQFTLSMIALLVAAAHASGQDFPAPKPGEGQKIFVEDVGTWDAVMKMYFEGPQGPAVEYKGVEVNELVSGGLFLKTSFKAKMGDVDFEGHGLVGYDEETKEYLSTWVDTFSATPTQTKGTWDAETKTLTVFNTVDGPDGAQMKMKQVTTRTGPGTKKMEHFLLLGDQAVKLMELVATKRKKIEGK